MLRFLVSAIAGISFLTLNACGEQPTARSGQVTATGIAQIGGAYELVNQDGEAVTDQSFIGKPQLIYFGFSYCPDVCPMALQKLGAVLSEIDPKAEYFQPIFISVDPERDTPESLKLYVTARGFPENLIGLTGTEEQVETAKTAYKIYSQKVADPESTAEYTVDHVSLVYLMGSDGKFLDVFTDSTTAPEMIKRLKLYKKRSR